MISGKKIPSRYASLSRRMWAATIDSVILLLLIAPLIDVLISASLGAVPNEIDLAELNRRLQGTSDAIGQLSVFWAMAMEAGIAQRFLLSSAVQSLVLAGLTGYCWMKWSATPGKMLLRIRVVDAKTDAPISRRQIVIRLLGYVVSSLPMMLGFFWAWFNRRRQGWHDKMAGTVVIVVPKP